MMHSKIKIVLLLAILSVVVLFACKKYTDPTSPAIDLGDRKYCNDPRAVNYNWGFPGKADKTTCIFAVDSFLGTWSFKDYVLLPSGDTDQIILRNLTFTSTEDTVLTHLAVTGWCGGNTPFYVTANNYGKLTVDTFPGSALGQFLCGTADTINGTLNKANYLRDTMKVEITVNNAIGIKYHKGLAIKQ
jgi:hypothetical protein